MKCICPSGGNRVCPDNCLWATWHKLPDDQKTKERRRPIVKVLREQGYTQEAIALQLGVSHQTVGRDIETLSMMDNVKGQGKDTLGRKRSTGRPKNTRKPGEKQKQRSINAKPEDWQRFKEKAEAKGKSAAEILGELIAEPVIERADLSMSAQEKFDAAIRQYKRKLDAEFELRVLEECNKRLNELSLPAYVAEMAKLEHSITSRKGIMTEETFKLILRCLHPDKSASVEKHNRAFHEFNSLEKRLLNEKESPTVFRPMPRTTAEMMAMRKSKNKKPSVRSDKKRLHASVG